MARTGAPNSAGGAVVLPSPTRRPTLDAHGTYVVFGTITEGLDVAEAILALAATRATRRPRRSRSRRVEITET